MPLTRGTSDPRSAWTKADQMLSWPEVVPLLATRCLYQGVHLTKGQSDPKADQMSNWPEVVPLLTDRCCYWGYLTKGLPDPKVEQMSSWSSITLDHYMPLTGVHLTKGQPEPKADQMSSWPEVVPLLTTGCCYWGYIWPQVSLTQRLTKCQADLK